MNPACAVPRLVVAGVSSGVGKTSATVGLISALRARGLKVAAFKCGPDYLDPSYHARASGTACQNLDGWMMGREAVIDTFSRGSSGTDIAVIEGVMGLFDGTDATGEEGSTAEIAKWLQAPVLLVVDTSAMARTIAAVAKGFAEFDPQLQLAGVICNRVGSRGHLDLLRQALSRPPVVGGFPQKPEISFPERHLGLRTTSKSEFPDSLFDQWAALAAEWLDLDTILAIAKGAPEIADSIHSKPSKAKTVHIGIAHDEAFHFYYENNLGRLEALGAELVRFSPVHDSTIPDVDGLYLGGGYPEEHAEKLSANRGMLDSIRSFAARGGPIYAECGGMMYLSSGIRTLDGQLHPMANLIPVETVMSEKLQAIGYVEVETNTPTILGPAGLRFRGHQFRYSQATAAFGALTCAYRVRCRYSGNELNEGYCLKNVLGSYVHAHWASNPLAAEGFVRSCASWKK
jgi:cobyrinic acid a,c-diamide synthase